MFTFQQKKTPTNVCDLAGGTVGPRESVAAIAFTSANSSIQNLLKIKIPALEQPEVGAKFYTDHSGSIWTSRIVSQFTRHNHHKCIPAIRAIPGGRIPQDGRGPCLRSSAEKDDLKRKNTTRSLPLNTSFFTQALGSHLVW
jgi:hypothetical protein